MKTIHQVRRHQQQGEISIDLVKGPWIFWILTLLTPIFSRHSATDDDDLDEEVEDEEDVDVEQCSDGEDNHKDANAKSNKVKFAIRLSKKWIPSHKADLFTRYLRRGWRDRTLPLWPPRSPRRRRRRCVSSRSATVTSFWMLSATSRPKSCGRSSTSSAPKWSSPRPAGESNETLLKVVFCFTILSACHSLPLSWSSCEKCTIVFTQRQKKSKTKGNVVRRNDNLV